MRLPPFGLIQPTKPLSLWPPLSAATLEMGRVAGTVPLGQISTLSPTYQGRAKEGSRFHDQKDTGSLGDLRQVTSPLKASAPPFVKWGSLPSIIAKGWAMFMAG